MFAHCSQASSSPHPRAFLVDLVDVFLHLLQRGMGRYSHQLGARRTAVRQSPQGGLAKPVGAIAADQGRPLRGVWLAALVLPNRNGAMGGHGGPLMPRL
jgi:hypothetical protein